MAFGACLFGVATHTGTNIPLRLKTVVIWPPLTIIRPPLWVETLVTLLKSYLAAALTRHHARSGRRHRWLPGHFRTQMAFDAVGVAAVTAGAIRRIPSRGNRMLEYPVIGVNTQRFAPPVMTINAFFWLVTIGAITLVHLRSSPMVL